MFRSEKKRNKLVVNKYLFIKNNGSLFIEFKRKGDIGMKQRNIFKSFGMSAMAIAMMLSAGNIVSPVLAAETGTITINATAGDSLAGKSFKLYKLMNLEKGSGDSYNYTVNSKYSSALKKATGKTTDAQVVDYISGLSETEMRQFSKKILKEVKSANLSADTTKEIPSSTTKFRCQCGLLFDTMAECNAHQQERMDNDDYGHGSSSTVSGVSDIPSTTISVDSSGYYMVEDATSVNGKKTTASLVMLNSAEPNTTITLKNSSIPTISKKVQEDDNNIGWNDIGDYNISQTIPFKYETKVPNMDGYDTYKFAFHDKADSAITLDKNSIKVTIGGKTVDASKYSTNATDGDTFDITFNDLKTAVTGIAQGQAIVVTYNGQINENAAKQFAGKDGYKNRVHLTFSNNANDASSMGTTEEDAVTVFTYKIQGSKVSTDQTKLKGAKFKLYTDQDCTQELKVKSVSGVYVAGGTTGTDIVSGDNGEFTIAGLDSGTYYLKETEAPSGYKKLDNPIKIVLTANYEGDRQAYAEGQNPLTGLTATADGKNLSTNTDQNTASLTITNSKGSKLPSTGSAMTMVTVCAGAVIVAVANKKRKF